MLKFSVYSAVLALVLLLSVFDLGALVHAASAAVVQHGGKRIKVKVAHNKHHKR